MVKKLPSTPVMIGAGTAVMGCIFLAGLLYALIVPRGAGLFVAQATPTSEATRGYVTATPILTATPSETPTPSPSPTEPATSTPTATKTRPAATRAPATKTPAPTPTPYVYGAELGLDQLNLYVPILSQGTGLKLPVTFTVHNNNPWIFKFGYLGVAAHDLAGNSVAFAKSKINDYLDADEYLKFHDAIVIDQPGQFDLFFVVCVSANDVICDTPQGEYHQLAPPVRVTITG